MARKDKQARQAPATNRRAAAGDEFFLDSAHELPRADLGGVTKLKTRARFYRGYIITACVLLPFTAVGYLALLPSYLNADNTAQGAEVVLDTPTKAAASNALNQWLNAAGDPLPGGFILSWDGTEDSVLPTVLVDENGGQTAVPGMETHKFTLGTKSGALFTTTIQVSWDDITGPQVLGGPSLTPVAPSAAGGGEVNPWPGTKASKSSDSVPQAIAAWVEAYTSGDPDRLRMATGDPSSKNSYIPLVQVSSVSEVSVAQSATREDGLTLARISFNVIWEGTPTNDRGEPESDGALVTYDVLLDRADTASPIVVAWGGAGTGLDLMPYSNAIAGRDVKIDEHKVWSEEELEQRAASQPEK